mmetsp:Transcript_5503/g.7128  ORF Transcript_5503/g.7128 Transcript_5503/m.7128 type:complete len:96 (+) Transcript_5503:30-317(+)
MKVFSVVTCQKVKLTPKKEEGGSGRVALIHHQTHYPRIQKRKTPPQVLGFGYSYISRTLFCIFLDPLRPSCCIFHDQLQRVSSIQHQEFAQFDQR